ncbi:MAG TPA: DDE-type integrase/transposase/recombinase [Labilithrix sp.]|nr:DDE-type integrase/transposase/recombinase [Labilithrix sp.]
MRIGLKKRFSDGTFATERLIGEQAQVDWAHVGKIKVPGGERALWVFVMVLAYSRAMWAELVFDLTSESLRRSLVRAAKFFEGITRQWLFDNPKIVVLERHGDAVRYHPSRYARTRDTLTLVPATPRCVCSTATTSSLGTPGAGRSINASRTPSIGASSSSTSARLVRPRCATASSPKSPAWTRSTLVGRCA